MPVTHGVTGSSPVRTADILKVNDFGDFFVMVLQMMGVVDL